MCKRQLQQQTSLTNTTCTGLTPIDNRYDVEEDANGAVADDNDAAISPLMTHARGPNQVRNDSD